MRVRHGAVDAVAPAPPCRVGAQRLRGMKGRNVAPQNLIASTEYVGCHELEMGLRILREVRQCAIYIPKCLQVTKLVLLPEGELYPEDRTVRSDLSRSCE